VESALLFLKIELVTLRLTLTESIAPPKAVPPAAVVSAILSRKRQLLTTVSTPVA
jgi:hypothetical protein